MIQPDLVPQMVQRADRSGDMANLVLELKPGETMVINGAIIRFHTKSRIELASRARFLFGKQIMSPEEATTPAKKIYYAVQVIYIGVHEERDSALIHLRHLITILRDNAIPTSVRQMLEMIEDHAVNDNCYLALKLGRQMINHEDTMLKSQGSGS